MEFAVTKPVGFYRAIDQFAQVLGLFTEISNVMKLHSKHEPPNQRPHHTTLALSSVIGSINKAGHAVDMAEETKRKDYEYVGTNYMFNSLAFKSFGTWG